MKAYDFGIKTKAIVILLLLSFLISVLSTTSFAATVNRTQEEAIAWIKASEGKSYDVDNYPAEQPYQCVDYIKVYYEYLIGNSNGVAGNGKDYATNYVPDGFSRIKGATPEAGDILVYNATADNKYGHVGIYISDYVHYDQNVTTKNGSYHYVYRCTWHYNYNGNYWGVIRPIWKNSTTPKYIFDVNTTLDGTAMNSGQDSTTFDVYIGGSRVADDVHDYYNGSVTDGSKYTVNDIKVSGCFKNDGNSSYSGTVSGGTTSVNIPIVSEHASLSWKTGGGNTYNYICDKCGKTIKSVTLRKTEEIGKNKYYFFDGRLTWWQAKGFSQWYTDGGHLMSVTDAREQQILDDDYAANGKTGLWLGGTDVDNEGTWTWITGEPFEYTNWNSGEPNNSGGYEDYLCTWSGPKWNDAGNGSDSITGFVIETDCKHDAEAFGAVAATCTQPGKTAGEKCTVCGAIISGGETIPALGHDYVSSFVGATCTDDAVFRYTCSRCQDSYDEPATQENTATEWSTVKPDGDESLIETKTEYRYKNTETKTSYNSSESGWTQTGSQWVQSGSGTIDYVSTWPSGFDRNNSIYKKYSSVPKASDNGSTKRELGSASTVGYIYWHWSYPLSGNHSEANRLMSENYNEFISGCGRTTIFEAFESSSPVEFNSSAKAFKATGHSTYTYWWIGMRGDSSEQLPIKRVSYTDYKQQYTYTRETDWSAWQSAQPSGATTTETRTLYRLLTDETELKATGHIWDDGVITKQPTVTEQGIKTFTCSSCGETKTEIISPIEQENEVFITVGNAAAAAGSTVQVDVSISNNVYIDRFEMGFVYDTSRLKLTDVAAAQEIGGQFEYRDITAVWRNADGTDYNGVIMTLTFEVLPDAEAGDAVINAVFSPEGMGGHPGILEHYNAVAGKVTVGSYTPGDINNDGKVNNKDLTRLMKYLAGEEVTVVEQALDVNGDGKTNNKDLTRLMKYLAGENVAIH